MGKTEFVAPASLKEAETRRIQLISEIEGIQLQLSDRNRQAHGHRMDEHEWNQWRTKAIYSLRCKTEESRLLKLWMREERLRVEAGAQGLDPSDPESVIRAAYALLKKCLKLGLTLDERDSTLLGVMEQWAKIDGGVSRQEMAELFLEYGAHSPKCYDFKKCDCGFKEAEEKASQTYRVIGPKP